MILSHHDPLAALSANFIVWAATPAASFLRGKTAWVNWDVEELAAKKAEIEGTDLLSIGLIGWPFTA